MNAIEQVKERLDLVEIVEESGVRLRQVGRAFQGFCPFHDNTRTPAFTVYPDTQSFYCFGCQASGTVFDFVMHQQGIDFRTALEHLARRARVDLSAESNALHREQNRQRERFQEITTLAARYFHYLLMQHSRGEPGRAYVAQRGLDDQTLEGFQIGYALHDSDHLLRYLTEKKGFPLEEIESAGLVVRNKQGRLYDRFRDRIIFPIRNERGEVVGFGGRSIGSTDAGVSANPNIQTPKYLNTPQTSLFDKGRVLYGLDQAREAIRTTDQAIMVEGYLDVLTAHQHGFRNVVAPLGTAITREHVRLLKKRTRTVLFALDADAAGLRAMEKGIRVMKDGDHEDSSPMVSAQGLVRWESEINIRVLPLPAGHDPDDVIRADPQQWRELVANAESVLDFSIAQATAGRDMRCPTDQREALNILGPLLAQLPGDQQRIYVSHLERIIGLRAEYILDIVQSSVKKGAVCRAATRHSPPASSSPQSPETWEETLLVAVLSQPATAAAMVNRLLVRGLEDRPQVRDLLGVDVEALLGTLEYRLIWQAIRNEELTREAGTWVCKESSSSIFNEPLSITLARLQAMQLPHDTPNEVQRVARMSAIRLRIAQVQQWTKRIAERCDEVKDTQAMQLLQAMIGYLGMLKRWQATQVWEEEKAA